MRIFVCFLVVAAFTTAAIADVDYTQPFTVDNFTLGLWHFDQNTGDTIVPDAAGYENNYLTTVWLGVSGMPAPHVATCMEVDPDVMWVPSKAGFDTCTYTYWNSSSDSNVGPLHTPDDNNLNIGSGRDLTIEFWIRPFGLSSGYWNERFMSKYTGGDYKLSIQDKRIQLTWWGGAKWNGTFMSLDVDTNTWSHIAVTWDRTSEADTDTIACFINGSVHRVYDTNRPDDTWPASSTSTENLTVLNQWGAHPGFQFEGHLDELRISNCVRAYDGRPGQEEIDIKWLKPVGSDAQMQIATVSEDKYFIKQASAMDGTWTKVDGFTGDKYYTTRTVSNGFTGSKQFFVAHCTFTSSFGNDLLDEEKGSF